jgi:hypothetical protein
MWTKLILSAAAVLAAALFAFLGDRLINAYGAARYQAGLAEGQLQPLPAILTANASAARAGLDARDRLIAAEHNHATEAVRLAALIRQSEDEGKAYEASNAGGADCLDAERVHSIEATRAALFPAAPAQASGGGQSGPVPADATRQTSGRNPG